MRTPDVDESGGVTVALTEDPLVVQTWCDRVADAGAGAVLAFVGTVRDSKHGRQVIGIDYEAYAPMAERELRRLANDIRSRFGARRVAVAHRIGRLAVGDPSVVIAVSTAHRAEGFDALRHAIETLKKNVPIWKKERFEDGEVWVQEGS
jgi:molybdopterin synthase catalytic subunit